MTRALLRIAAIVIAALAWPGAGRAGEAHWPDTLTIAHGLARRHLPCLRRGARAAADPQARPARRHAGNRRAGGKPPAARNRRGRARVRHARHRAAGMERHRRLDRWTAIAQRAGAVSDVRHAVPVRRHGGLGRSVGRRSRRQAGRDRPAGRHRRRLHAAAVQGDQHRGELHAPGAGPNSRPSSRARKLDALVVVAGVPVPEVTELERQGQYPQSDPDAEPAVSRCGWRCRRSRPRSSRPAPIRRCGAITRPSACTISPSRAPICPTTWCRRSSTRCSTIPTR